MQYTPAIDGLRALAVVAVLLFHAKAPWFGGGFVGVDVFFVISGYLITSLILHEHADGRFTLAGFYERRIRRIFPALLLVVLSTLVTLLTRSPNTITTVDLLRFWEGSYIEEVVFRTWREPIFTWIR